MNLLGGLGGTLPWGMPATLPRIVCWIVRLTCLGVREVRRSPVFQWRQESHRLGGKGGRGCTGLRKTGIFPGRGRLGGKGGKGGISLGKTGIFPRRGRVGGKGVRGVLTWERLASSPGGVAPAWGRVLSSPAWLLACKGAGEVLASLWGDLPGKTCCLPWGVPGRLPDCYLGNYSCGYGYDYSNLD